MPGHLFGLLAVVLDLELVLRHLRLLLQPLRDVRQHIQRTLRVIQPVAEVCLVVAVGLSAPLVVVRSAAGDAHHLGTRLIAHLLLRIIWSSSKRSTRRLQSQLSLGFDLFRVRVFGCVLVHLLVLGNRIVPVHQELQEDVPVGESWDDIRGQQQEIVGSLHHDRESPREVSSEVHNVGQEGEVPCALILVVCDDLVESRQND